MDVSGPQQHAGVSSFTMKWKSSVSKSAASMPEPVRVEALRSLAHCCNNPQHKEELWNEIETRQALLSCAATGEPDVLRRIALAAVASLADAPPNKQEIWHDFRSVIVAGAMDSEAEGVRRQALWCVVNLCLSGAETDGGDDRESLWLDDAKDGAREIMQRSARQGQPEDLRLLAVWGLTNLAGQPGHRRSMWLDEATRDALLCCAEAGQPDLVRMQALRTLISLAIDDANRHGLSELWADRHDGTRFRAVLVAAASDSLAAAHEPAMHLLRLLQVPDAEVKHLIKAPAAAEQRLGDAKFAAVKGSPRIGAAEQRLGDAKFAGVKGSPRIGAVKFAVKNTDKDDARSEDSSVGAASASTRSEPTGGDQRDDSSSKKTGSHISSGKEAGSFRGQSNDRGEESGSSKLSGPGPTALTIKIPHGGKAGQKLRVIANGTQHDIIIPKGKKAGDLMPVEMPELQWPVLAAPEATPETKRPPGGHIAWIAPAEWKTDRDNVSPVPVRDSQKVKGILRGASPHASSVYLVNSPPVRGGMGKLVQLPKLPWLPSLSLPSLSLPSLTKVQRASALPGLKSTAPTEEVTTTSSGMKIVPMSLLTPELYKEATGRRLQIRNITSGLGLVSDSPGMLEAQLILDAAAAKGYDDDAGGSDSVLQSHDYED